jgi:hypothetical protein
MDKIVNEWINLLVKYIFCPKHLVDYHCEFLRSHIPHAQKRFYLITEPLNSSSFMTTVIRDAQERRGYSDVCVKYC